MLGPGPRPFPRLCWKSSGHQSTAPLHRPGATAQGTPGHPTGWRPSVHVQPRPALWAPTCRRHTDEDSTPTLLHLQHPLQASHSAQPRGADVDTHTDVDTRPADRLAEGLVPTGVCSEAPPPAQPGDPDAGGSLPVSGTQPLPRTIYSPSLSSHFHVPVHPSCLPLWPRQQMPIPHPEKKAGLAC